MLRNVEMARTVHDLAKEYGMGTKELVALLDRAGVNGKRSRSSLNDKEVELVGRTLAAERKPDVTIGRERVITGVSGQTVVERRVGKNVIRRRRKTPSPPSEPVEALEPIESVPLESGPPVSLDASLPVEGEEVLVLEVPEVAGTPPPIPDLPKEEVPLSEEDVTQEEPVANW
jgi:hypothetical protein